MQRQADWWMNELCAYYLLYVRWRFDSLISEFIESELILAVSSKVVELNFFVNYADRFYGLVDGVVWQQCED